MAIPKPEPGDWLKAAADELRQGDRATLKLLQETYRHINSILKGLPNQPDAAFGNLIYRAQLERTKRELLDAQSKLFDKLGDQVSARRLRAATRAAKLSTAATNALLLLVGGGEEGKRLYDGAVITAQRTVETMLARIGLSKVPLSERIYKTKVWMNGRLDRLIAQTMASGLNAQRFAKVARDWFAPSVPGGTRYAAYRLARTEINNAFHATSISYAQGKPWVSQMDWNLSKSHPAPDKCDEYAALSPWNVTEVPRKPHPQCMCYVTEVTPDEDDWIDRFVAGEFDDYLDAELAKADAGVDSAQTSATGAPVNVQRESASQQAKVAPPNPTQQAWNTGIKASLTLTGGGVAKTELVTTNSGKKLVRKTAEDTGRPPYNDPVRQQDAEELGAMLLRRLGVSAPETVRTAPEQIVMEYFDNAEVGTRISGDFARRMAREQDKGWIIGLFDDAVGNIDRNTGNWLVDRQDGTIHAIDHSYSFHADPGEESKPSINWNQRQDVYRTSPFWHLFHNAANGDWVDNDIAPADIRKFRGLLGELRPEFAAKGHEDWVDFALRRLEAILPFCKGTRSRL